MFNFVMLSFAVFSLGASVHQSAELLADGVFVLLVYLLPLVLAVVDQVA